MPAIIETRILNHQTMQPKSLSDQRPPTTLALFCKVVDNYGDIGICWRLARQLEQEHGIAVTLWVDDLPSFRRICPEVEVDRELQQISGVTVCHWRDQQGVFSAQDVADIVIEFFACDIPPGYIKAMSERSPRPVWLNLEGLSAEEWVEGCHALPSTQPRSLVKYFFFPGFTSRTGGLPLESGLLRQRQAFQQDARAMSAFLGQFGVTPAEMTATKASLFCYPQAPVAELFATWQNSGRTITCLVPEGVAADAVQAFLGQAATAGASATRGALTVRVLPFVPQPDYDKLLWACDLNFVRGEDSFVRAQWAAKPFIWHIYPQDKDLHHVKLNAFLQATSAKTASLIAFALGWNGAAGEAVDWNVAWRRFEADLPEIARLSTNWEGQLLANGDLATNLCKFAETVK
jgi:uncharacterized repeat protein (TIGR03837 family)